MRALWYLLGTVSSWPWDYLIVLGLVSTGHRVSRGGDSGDLHHYIHYCYIYIY